MALNIKNPEVERLVSELAEATGDSKTETIRQALLAQKARLQEPVTETARRDRLRRFLDREVWSRIPGDQLGHPPRKADREAILGYGPHGV